jgi:PAS domain S-box-containing protein
MPPLRSPQTTSPASLAWAALLDAASDLLALLDVQGNLVWVNAGFEVTSGYRWFDVAGRSAVELLRTPASEAEGWEAVHSDLLENRGFDGVELPWLDQAGATRWGRLSIQKLEPQAEPTSAHWLLALQDLTEVRSLTIQSKRVSELLETAQEFGRLGAWERKLPRGEERWDSHMYRFFGIKAQDANPSFEQVLQNMNDNGTAYREYRETLKRAGKHSKRYRIELPGRLVRHVHAQWEVKTSAAGIANLVTGIMMDDTEAYMLALSFNETSEQLKLAVDLGNIAIWRHDVQADRIFFNARTFEVLGIAHQADGVPTKDVIKQIHPDDWPAVQAAHETSMHTDRPVDTEARYKKPDGTWRYVLTRRRVVRDEQGVPIEFVGVALDVSEQVEKTRHASEMTKRLEIAASAAGLGIWSRDPITGKAEWNSQMFEIVGRLPAMGLPSKKEWLTQIIHPSDQPKMNRSHLDLVESNGFVVEHEYRITRPDGNVRWLVNRARREVRDGRAMQFGITMDVTDRVHAESEKQQRLMALRESEAKSEFLARMSHELRTPLNAVLGFAQLLSLAPDLNLEHREKVTRIYSAGEHLLSLINDVLDISSLEQGQLRMQLQPVRLANVINEALPLVEAMADAQGVTLHVDTLYGVAYGDRTRIRQVLINLLSNAIKYNRAQGRVAVYGEEEGAHVLLRVVDTGRGMSSQQLTQLFEPFNRLGLEKETVQGTGIGLALVKVLVERMGGSIVVSSEVGVGSEFEVRLPRWADTASLTEPGRLAPAVSAAASLTKPSISMDRGTGQVLYIEDNTVNQILLEELVRRHVGLRIESKDTGLGGVERARELRPQLILIDIQLPDIDGFEVLRRLRAQTETAHTHCIALSANAMPEDVSRALAEGFDDYWTKPIDFSIFIAAMDRLFPKIMPPANLPATAQPLH